MLPTLSETRVAVAVAGAGLDGGVGAAGEGDRASTAPKVPQVPSASVASERSTLPLEVSTPEPASVPPSRVSGTERAVYQGPPASAAACPVGAVASAVIVSESPPERPAPLVAVIVVEPRLPAPAVQL